MLQQGIPDLSERYQVHVDAALRRSGSGRSPPESTTAAGQGGGQLDVALNTEHRTPAPARFRGLRIDSRDAPRRLSQHTGHMTAPFYPSTQQYIFGAAGPDRQDQTT